MRKILSLVLGLMWALPVMAVDYSNCQNLFDGEYISVSNGHKAENANDFYVSPGERYVALWTTYTPAAMNLYGYDTQGNTVGSWSSGAYAPNGVSSPFSDNYMAWQKGAVFTVPDGVAYLRFNTFGNLSASQQQAWAESFKIYNMDCVEKIKIATTKYNETKFSPLNTALANAISVVDSVVSNTITQAASIATLQAQKQTRPNDIADDNEKCPAGKKCLLVEDASGIPHWYEIVENAWDLPVGYTQLQYIESTGTQWIDPDINITSTNIATFKSEAVISNVTREGGSISGYSSPSSKLWYGLTSTPPYEFYYSDGHQEKSLNIVSEFRYYKYVIDAPNGSYSVYTESDEAVASKTGLNFSTSNDFKFYLFTYSPTGTASAFKPQKIKYAKFWFDGALVRNLVPALNPDGKIGMYDLVGGRFYENAGTGEFIGGQPVFN